MLKKKHRYGLTILGFGGNAAPDHVDHFYTLPAFLKRLLDEEWPD